MSRIKKADNPVSQDGKVIAAVEETIETEKGKKILNYDAPLDEVKNEQNTILNEEQEFDLSDIEDFDEELFEEIPKSQIDIMFDRLLEVDAYGNMSFYAMILRLPDAMSDNFKIRCQNQMPLGTQIFSIRDRFIFQSALQKLNGDSGMRCAVRVCNENGEEVTIKRRKNFVDSHHPVGIAHLVIPNPSIEIKIENNNNSNSISDREFYAEMQKRSDERLEKMLLALKPQQSELEKKLIDASLDRVLNPPQPQTGDLNTSILGSALRNEIAQLRLIDRILPENQTPPPKTVVDSIAEYANSEAGLEIIDGIKQIVNLGISSKFGGQTVTIPQNEQGYSSEEFNPQQLQTNNEMEELVTIIVNEIDSDNEINSENETLIMLQTKYNSQYQVVKSACKVMTFENVFDMLIEFTKRMPVSPFTKFLDIPATQQQKIFIWNERGQRMQTRLMEVYELVKTIE